MALSPERIQELNDKYGVKPAGNSQLGERLRTAWGIEKPPQLGEGAAGEFAGGFVKSVAEPFRQLGRGIQKGVQETIGRGVEAVTGIEKEKVFPVAEKKISEEPETAAGKIGEVAGDIATFAMPGGGVVKLTKGIELLKVGPKAIQILVNALPRSVAEGLTGAGIISLQQGEVDGDSIAAGIVSGVIPFAGASGKALLESIPSLPARIVNSLIKPLKKDFSYGKNPGHAISEEGIVASNLDELSTKIGETLNTRTKELKAITSAADAKGIKIDISDTLKPIDEALEQANKAPRTNKAVIERLQGLKDDLLGITDVEGVPTATRKLEELLPSEAVDFKRLIGDLTKFTGNQSDDQAVNAALKGVYGKVKEKVNSAVPESAALNERIADLISAKVATDYREIINARQGLAGLTEKAGAGALALAEVLASGGSVDIGTVIAGVVGFGATKAASSPQVKLGLAKWLANASPEDKKKLFEAAPWVKALTIESIFGEEGMLSD